jgi:hypothetical protein
MEQMMTYFEEGEQWTLRNVKPLTYCLLKCFQHIYNPDIWERSLFDFVCEAKIAQAAQLRVRMALDMSI